MEDIPTNTLAERGLHTYLHRARSKMLRNAVSYDPAIQASKDCLVLNLTTSHDSAGTPPISTTTFAIRKEHLSTC
ncbi:unnamed protein product [Rodentolepis nana]|uniref:Uncharacterized protein n=1 Tax=Rodentolepis nana TaxID=102285 RepID=A0A0R3TN49_RODNA|nr:unnamed protein product [Rodentolepis nana]